MTRRTRYLFVGGGLACGVALTALSVVSAEQRGGPRAPEATRLLVVEKAAKLR